MKIVLIGIQAAGKSTQGNLLSKSLHIPYLSTGHIFRIIAKEKTALGRYIKETINAGILIPDKKTISIVNNYLSRPGYKLGYILDGFPRTIEQAKQFKNNVDNVIYLKISEKEALWRICHRNDKLREDETLPALKKRIELFHKFKDPIIRFYERQKKLRIIDGTQSIKDIHKEILMSLGKQVIKNQVKSWKKKQKSIIAIVGLPGSGKTKAASYYRKKDLPIISFSNIINDYIDKNKLEHTETVHKKLRKEFRDKYGKEAMAHLSKEKITKALKDNIVVVIEGMRSWEEYLFLKEHFKSVKTYILGIYARKEIRHKRSAKRKYRKGLYGETRDINELIGTHMGPTISYSDFLIKNNYSLEDFNNELETVYRSVYYS